jgi:hypothetical protein
VGPQHLPPHWLSISSLHKYIKAAATDPIIEDL